MRTFGVFDCGAFDSQCGLFFWLARIVNDINLLLVILDVAVERDNKKMKSICENHRNGIIAKKTTYENHWKKKSILQQTHRSRQLITHMSCPL